MPAPDFMPDNRPVVVVGHVTPAVRVVERGPWLQRLRDDDVERIAQRVAELIKADK